MIKAPFNFVPLNSNLCGVEDNISLDMPFSDGLSGQFTVRLEALSPIYVRNGLAKPQAEELRKELTRKYDAESEYSDFNNINVDGQKKYFIPGSTLKGLMRSTVETISFGKFSQVENQSFGKRDLNDPSYRRLMQGVRCGWLMKKDGKLTILDCGEPVKVEAGLIDEAFVGLGFMNFIKNDIKKDSDKTAMRKYRLFMNYKNISDFSDVHEELAVSLDELDGVVVFTGQPNKYVKDRIGRKYHEFIFPDVADTNDRHRDVPEIVYKAFCSIYADSEDWIATEPGMKEFCWNTRLEKGGKVPVFFTLDSTGKEVETMGLSRMYKYPYEKSVHDVIPENLRKETKTDLAESIFGKISGGSPLKGRVHAGSLFAEGSPESAQPVAAILGRPHPSYAPIYLRRGNTWDTAAELAGRKFYPSRCHVYSTQGAVDINGRLVNSATVFRPLEEGTVFSGTVSFFNLRPYELGAIISALTFFGDGNSYHTIGMGKPLGYGKVKVELSGLKVRPNKTLQCVSDAVAADYVQCFRKFMSDRNKGWEDSATIKQFKVMGKGIPVGKEDRFKYMTMSNRREENEFLQCKNRGEKLPRFTEI